MALTGFSTADSEITSPQAHRRIRSCPAPFRTAPPARAAEPIPLRLYQSRDGPPAVPPPADQSSTVRRPPPAARVAARQDRRLAPSAGRPDLPPHAWRAVRLTPHWRAARARQRQYSDARRERHARLQSLRCTAQAACECRLAAALVDYASACFRADGLAMLADVGV